MAEPGNSAISYASDNQDEPLGCGTAAVPLGSRAMADAHANDATDPLSGASLSALRAQDRDAFEAVVRAHHHALLAVARGLVGSDDADDVVQRAWIKAYQGISRFEGRAQLRTWLTRITINEAKMRLRQLKRERERIAATGAADADWLAQFDAAGRWKRLPVAWDIATPEDILNSEELTRCLREALAALPPNQRAVLQRRDLEGAALQDIAHELALSDANVRVLLHRARVRMYLAIDRFQESGEW